MKRLHALLIFVLVAIVLAALITFLMKDIPVDQAIMQDSLQTNKELTEAPGYRLASAGRI